MSRCSMCALLAVAVLLTAGLIGRGQVSTNDPFSEEPASKPVKTAPEKPQPKKTATKKSLPKKAAPTKKLHSGEAAIERALDEPTSIEFVETPLQDVIDYLRERHSIEIQLDKVAMEEVGIGTDTPVTKKIKGVSLRSALHLMLHELKLTYTIEDDVLLITTPETEEAHETTRIYDVADLVVSKDERRGWAEDYDTLKDVICCHVDPSTWEGCGPSPISGGSIGSAKILVIPQTYEVHRDIADLLKQIRAVAAKHSAEGAILAVPTEKPADVAPKNLLATKAAPAKELCTGEAAIERALDEPTSFDFVETPLQDVIEYLKEKHRIEIQLDNTSMDDVGLGTDTPITKKLSGISLRSALRLILRDVCLSFTVQDEVLFITTPETYAAHLTTRVYDVADLVVYYDDIFGRWEDYDLLIETITSTLEPKAWDRNQGPGSISRGSFGTAKILVVSQTYEAHREITRLLKEIRAVAAKHSGEGLPRSECPWKRASLNMGGMDMDMSGGMGMGGTGGVQQQPATGNAAQPQGVGGGMFAVPGK